MGSWSGLIDCAAAYQTVENSDSIDTLYIAAGGFFAETTTLLKYSLHII